MNRDLKFCLNTFLICLLRERGSESKENIQMKVQKIFGAISITDTVFRTMDSDNNKVC